MSSRAEPVGTVDVALARAARLLDSDPRLAAEQATEVLRAVPNHPTAGLLLGTAPGVGAYVVWNCTVETLDVSDLGPSDSVQRSM